MTAKAPRQPLSRDRIVETAFKIADREGMAAVILRRVAGELGVETMSLYHHVPGKEQLLDAMAEQIITEVDAAISQQSAVADWQTAVRRRCLTAREIMVEHRWAPALISSRTAIPTNLYPYYEALLTTLIDGGFSYHLAHQAIHALGSMTLGFTQELFSPPTDGDTLDDEAAEAELAAMAELLPHLTAMVAAELHDNQEDPLGWCDSQAEFEFTLDLLLDGLARHLARNSDQS
jgi:AcrR family transcriptional regulator